MHCPVASSRKVIPPISPLGHGMNTQWPVLSAPLPLEQIQAPMRISPSMHGGGAGSAGTPAEAGGSALDGAGGGAGAGAASKLEADGAADAVAGGEAGVGAAAGGGVAAHASEAANPTRTRTSRV